MKKLFYVILSCLVFSCAAYAEGADEKASLDSTFFHVVYNKTASYALDSTTVKSESRQLILTTDSCLAIKDNVWLILSDTTIYKPGLGVDSFLFVLDSIDVNYLDTTATICVRYLPADKTDTLSFCLPIVKYAKNTYDPQPPLLKKMFSAPLLWWTIGGLVLLVVIISGCVFFIIPYLKKKKQRISEVNDIPHNNVIEVEPIKEDVSEKDPVETGSDGEKDEEIRQLKSIISELKEKQRTLKEKIENEAKEVLDDAQKKWEKEKEKIEHDHQKELDKRDSKIRDLNEEIRRQKDKVKTIREEVIVEKKKEIDSLNEKLNTVNEDLRTTKKELSSTKTTLEDTQENLSNANKQIEYLQESQRQYAEKITFVPYAESYSNQIKKLFDIEHSISEGVIKLSKKGLEDPYHLFKATHRFKTGLAEIDMEKFQVEVEMAAKKQMTFTGNGIAHLATLKGDELAKQVRLYFVLNYLSKYIGALQIYNESLIGLEKLMEDVSASDVSQFVQARQQLESLYAEMQIKVICPHLFDSIGNNMDLRVEQIDAGFDSGDILEIMNCLVYAVDGQKPTDKIFVKAQQ